MKNPKAHTKILKARTALVLNHPFFASLALRLTVKEDPSCETAWTDGRVFAYNPDYVNILPSDKLLGLAAHTVMHPACNHHTRRNDRDPDLWNRACDYAINPILLEAGLTLPDGFLFDEQYKGKSADAVYESLVAQKSDNQEKKDAPDQEKDDKTDTDLEEEEEAPVKAKPGKEEKDSQASDDSDDATGDPGKSGEIRDMTPPDADQSDDHETDWDEALIQAATNARGMGKLPAGLDLFIQERVNPKLCWQELLSRFIETSARSDYSWVTPNRRYVHQGLYLPSLRNNELADIVIAVDTSGSIQATETDQFAAELSAIMENNPATIHLIYCDMAVTGYQRLERADLPVTIRPKGGGGTDFRPAFDLMAKQNIDPACFIYLTDLECKTFPKAPAYPVLWVRTGEGSVQPPFGEVITLN
ncbi:MAG: hypothetical protein GY737_04125 [Desulfobacteraceae bacterium]|nr:hypothetical protein [Desulfobacteraceae bacterium]